VVSIVHAPAATYRAAMVVEDGAAVVHCDRSAQYACKQAAYARAGDPCFDFVPFSVEIIGIL
jgi:hypothetical protein